MATYVVTGWHSAGSETEEAENAADALGFIETLRQKYPHIDIYRNDVNISEGQLLAAMWNEIPDPGAT